jgi:fructose-1,6-bisphosphatase II / sedoheptulose-1,7-bisphosphatase
MADSRVSRPMLSLGLARVSEAAALASAGWVGRGDEKAADQAAVDAMRTQLNLLDIDGVVVIGEGERDEAPMLLHRRGGRHRQRPGGGHRARPAGGHDADRQGHAERADRDRHGPARHACCTPPTSTWTSWPSGRAMPGTPSRWTCRRPSGCARWPRAKGCAPSDITVCILERPRHEELIAEVRETGAAIRLITDGDVAGVIHCAEPDVTGIDMYMGSGGAPEGVLAAAALRCMGGQIYGRLLFRNDDEARPRPPAGITDLDRIYSRDEMVTADVIFAATGVTDGSILPASGASRAG